MLRFTSSHQYLQLPSNTTGFILVFYLSKFLSSLSNNEKSGCINFLTYVLVQSVILYGSNFSSPPLSPPSMVILFYCLDINVCGSCVM